MLSLFVQYPNREQVLREVPAFQDLAEVRTVLEVYDDQHLLVADAGSKNQTSIVERVDQLFDGASLRVTVPRRRVFVGLEGGQRRQVTWYPGASAEQIESAITKACGLALGTPIELIDGGDAVVISATIPNNSTYTVVPMMANGGSMQSNGLGRLGHGATASATSSQQLHRRGDESPGTNGNRAPYTPNVPTVPRPGSVRNIGTPAAGGGGVAQRSRSTTPQQGNGTAATGAVAPSAPPWPHLPRADSAFAGRSSSRAGSPSSRDHATAGGAGYPGGAAVDLAAQPTGKVSAPDEHCVHILAGHAGFVLSLCTVGDVLFTGSQDCNIMIWDLNNLQYIGTLPGHRGFVKCMVATLSRKLLCSGSQDRTIKVWSLDTFSSTKTLHGHSGEVNALTILEGVSIPALISGSEDKSIRVWDLSSLAILATLEQAHGGSVFALRPLEGGLFLSASRDRTMKVWTAATWQARRTLNPPHYDGVSDVAVGRQKGFFFSASRDRSIRRWDARSYESSMQLTHAHGDWLTSLALAPSENVLFSGSKDCVVKVWDPDLHCKDLLFGHRGAISSLITIDGHLFSASHDRTVRVWRVSQYEP
mmetsp:Transcript_48045/g.134140  ORF Transcript_48045/g.134140 Transcript_48045/m.134140 type:complete len:590 (-) Transcript_48045:97-1866(-)